MTAAGEAGHAPEPAARPARWWSRLMVAGSVAAVGAVAAVHLLATFLYNAPPNPVSRRYAHQVDTWMNPVFRQDWQLFAPNPVSQDVSVQARASVGPGGRVTPWTDLSAQDLAATAGDPLPGKMAQNALRSAWFQWDASHDAQGDPTAPDADVMQQFLLRLVVDRLRPLAGGPIGSVQIRVVSRLLPGPGRTAAQTAARTRTLDWWTV